jgi:RES domain-containing protein
MLIYRAVKRDYLESYDGMGNSYRKGVRWNLPNHPVLYFAPNPSVAALELANYFPSPDLVPKNYVMGEYEIPDPVKIKTILLEDLPKNWKDYPHPNSTKKIGSAWLREGKESCLFVPSAATPGNLEHIIVINPKHPDLRHIKLTQIIQPIYSDRIFKGL